MWGKKHEAEQVAQPVTQPTSPIPALAPTPTPASTSYETMPFKELFQLHQVIGEYVDRRRTEARAELESQMELFGLSAKGGKAKKKKRTFPARYRDPENEANTWSGMGKPKKWLQNYLDQGRALEDFAVE